MDSALEGKTEFDQDNVNTYLCGSTVYDDAHLDHVRSSACFNLSHRVLFSSGYRVQFARNYTDMDDKILEKMSESGRSLNESIEFYITNYERNMKALNVSESGFKPRATHCIELILDLIRRPSKNGLTYILEDGVYFGASKGEDYLSLSHCSTEEDISRLGSEIEKRNENDLVLWKFDEDSYDSEFGKG